MYLRIRLNRAIIGINATMKVGEEVKKFSPKRVLIISSKTVGKSELCNKILDLIPNAEVWNGVKPEPDLGVLNACIDHAKDYDCYIALGGGSVIDIAKLANLCITTGKDVQKFLPKPIGEGNVYFGKLKPLIAIPTTAGTGSEVTCAAVIKLKKLKVGITLECLLPDLAIVDPINTLTCPKNVTASSGFDALMHALEAYTTKPSGNFYCGANPITDALAEKALKLIVKSLERAYRVGDLNSRYDMSLAAFIAGMAFGNAGVHIGHALAHAIGGLKNIPHGVCLASVGSAVLNYIFDYIPEWKRNTLREIFGGDPVEKINELRKKLNLPSLSDLGFSESQAEEIAENAAKLKRIVSLCPRKVDVNGLKKVIISALSIC